MTDTLAVDVNRAGMHTLDVPETFQADGPFVVELENHGEAAHVYLNLDDRLSELAHIDATNHYVGSHETRTVEVQVRDSERWPRDVVRGKIKVVVAHGQETHWVDVTFDRTPEKQPVEVAPELTHPRTDDAHTAESSSRVRVLPVVVLGAVAILLAVGAVVAAGGVDYVLAGFAVLTAALCAVAAHYLLG